MTYLLPLLAATIFVTPSPQAASTALLSLDSDGNEAVNQDELQDLVREMIERFDHDRDGALRTSDLHRLAFQLWDESDDLLLDRNEFDRARSWDSGLSEGDFDRLDGDGNGLLGLPEFMAFGERAMYAEWDSDRDGLVDQFELSAKFLSIFDSDNNSTLDADELGAAPLVWPVAASTLSTVSEA